MITFYKYHLHYLSEQAVAADHRRYVIPEEAPRHYLDFDYFGTEVTRDWDELLQNFPTDSITEHGILPWHLISLKYSLISALKLGNVRNILRLSADAGHYIADAHVPLHTTRNYNGQLTNQRGIHGFWETRVPELLHDHFDLWIGKAHYVTNWDLVIWDILLASYMAVDSVLLFDRTLTRNLPEEQKYSYEIRLNKLVKVYSKEYTTAYHKALNYQVERRMRAAILTVGSFWYSCWIDAGQPDMDRLLNSIDFDSVDYQIDSDIIWRKQHIMRK